MVLLVSLAAYDRPVAQPKGAPEEQDRYLRNQVKNTIIKNAKRIQSCYLDFLKKSPVKKEGSVKLDWQILPGGVVTEAAVVTSDFQDPAFEKCLVQKITEIKFPPTEKAANKYVAHQFHFKDEKLR